MSLDNAKMKFEQIIDGHFLSIDKIYVHMYALYIQRIV